MAKSKPAAKPAKGVAKPAAKGAVKGAAKPVKGAAKATPVVKPKSISKSELFTELATASGLTRKDVSTVFEALTAIIQTQLGKGGPGVLNVLPGLLKLQTVHKPATPEHQKPNPFNKSEMMTVKAKPATTSVKPRALKPLKGMFG